MRANVSVTYGALIGMIFWLRIAQGRPGSFLKDVRAELVFGNWVMGTVIGILIWQQLFWRI
jgi:hypothetical protein